jgi:hypothetical protein
MNPVWWDSVSGGTEIFRFATLSGPGDVQPHCCLVCEGNVVPHEANWGSGGIAPLILNLSTEWWWVFGLHFTHGKPPSPTRHRFIRRLGGSQSRFGRVEKKFLSLTIEESSRSQWPCGLWRGSTAARLLELWVRIPSGHGCVSVVSVVCC